jgi:hypothetical protein
MPLMFSITGNLGRIRYNSTPQASLPTHEMKYLLDTDILIDVLRGYPPSIEWLATLTETPYCSHFL